MFTPADHAYVGKTLRYSLPFLPDGTPTSFDWDTHTCNVNGWCILHPGDTVDVLSAWNRNAFNGDDMVLLHVMSHATGACTHVPVYTVSCAGTHASIDELLDCTDCATLLDA